MADPTGDLPVSIKHIRPYLMRAGELQAAYPLVSYYCKLFALQQAVDSRDKSDPAAVTFVKNLLTDVETQCKTITGTRTEHRAQVEAAALDLFDGAAAKYRAGNANSGTAMRFFAAKCVIDVSSFVDDQPLTEFLGSYRMRAVRYAANIRSDLRENRIPDPPQELFDEMAPATAEEEVELASLGGQTHRRAPANPSLPATPATPSHPFTSSEAETHAAAHAKVTKEISGFSKVFPENAPSYPTSGEPSPLSYRKDARPPSPPPTLKPVQAPVSPPSSASVQPGVPPVLIPARGLKERLARPDRAVPAPPILERAVENSSAAFDVASIVEAQRRSKAAVSALDFQDVPTAIAELRAALAQLSSSK
jgi:vacuolar protein sorting-associated protein VTA1